MATSRADVLTIRAADGTSISVHVFPGEPGLRADLRRVALAVAPATRGEADLREEVQRTLRMLYPLLRITRREELATLTSDERVWYVLRDGHVGKPRPRIDRLHAALASARETTEASDEAIHRAEAILGRALTSHRSGRPTSPGESG